MAEMNDLRQQALDVIQEATDYLNRRENYANSPVELDVIREHRDWMGKALTVIATTSFRTPEENAELIQVAADLEQSKNRIGSFHETTPFSDVDQVLQGLDQRLSMFVGTHGPGGGNPIGWPR